MLLKSKLENLTYHMLPNIPSVSGINSDSDLQVEWKFLKREPINTLLLVLLKMPLILMNNFQVIELYLSLWTLGNSKTINHNILSVLMTMKEIVITSVNQLNSLIPMLMPNGSMSILDSLQLKLKLILPLLVQPITKLLLFHKFIIMLHQANCNSTSELHTLELLMVTSIMSNSTMLKETLWELKLLLDNLLNLFHSQISSTSTFKLKLSKLN